MAVLDSIVVDKNAYGLCNYNTARCEVQDLGILEKELTSGHFGKTASAIRTHTSNKHFYRTFNIRH